MENVINGTLVLGGFFFGQGLTELMALLGVSQKKKKIGVVVMTENTIHIKYTDFSSTRYIYIKRMGNSSCSL